MKESYNEFKSTFKDITKYSIVLFVSLVSIGAYVIQRSYMAVFFSDSLVSEFVDKTRKSQQQSQVSFKGLTFTYGAMNMFWPIIIFLLFVSIFYFLKKQSAIYVEIKKSDNVFDSQLLFDPMNLFKEIQNDKLGRFILPTLLFIPLIALVTHLLSGLYIFWFLETEQVSDMDSSDALTRQLYYQLFISTITLILSISFPNKIWKIIKHFRS